MGAIRGSRIACPAYGIHLRRDVAADRIAKLRGVDPSNEVLVVRGRKRDDVVEVVDDSFENAAGIDHRCVRARLRKSGNPDTRRGDVQEGDENRSFGTTGKIAHAYDFCQCCLRG